MTDNNDISSASDKDDQVVSVLLKHVAGQFLTSFIQANFNASRVAVKNYLDFSFDSASVDHDEMARALVEKHHADDITFESLGRPHCVHFSQSIPLADSAKPRVQTSIIPVGAMVTPHFLAINSAEITLKLNTEIMFKPLSEDVLQNAAEKKLKWDETDEDVSVRVVLPLNKQSLQASQEHKKRHNHRKLLWPWRKRKQENTNIEADIALSFEEKALPRGVTRLVDWLHSQIDFREVNHDRT